MLALFCSSLAIGWFIGGPESGARVSAAMSCSGRNVALALVITANAFPGTPASAAVLAYAVVSLSGSYLAARLMGARVRREAAPQ